MCAAGIGYIGAMVAALGAAGKLPDQEAVDGSTENVAGLCLLPRVRNMIEHPADFQRAEIARQGEAGLPAITVLAAMSAEVGNIAGHARVLPDDGIVHRLAGSPVPHDRGLTLVGDANRCQICGMQSCLLQGASDYRFGSLPDLFGVMFHPAGVGINLLVFLASAAHDVACAVEDDETGAGRPLINRADVICHSSATPWIAFTRSAGAIRPALAVHKHCNRLRVGLHLASSLRVCVIEDIGQIACRCDLPALYNFCGIDGRLLSK